MGTFLVSYGDAGYDHEGYAGQVLDDGTITGTYSSETTPRMINQVVAVCGCGWTGTTRYPSRDLFDEDAEQLALHEWEHTHARPVLERSRDQQWHRLQQLLARLAGDLHAQLKATGPGTGQDRHELLDRTLRALDDAQELARDLRDP